MSRIFWYLYHAGEVYGRDSVRWYTASGPEHAELLLNTYHNLGDSVVYDSTLKLLDYDELVPLDPNSVDDATLEWVNSECDYGIISGSNYLYSVAGGDGLKRFLDQITVPVASPGIAVTGTGRYAAVSVRHDDRDCPRAGGSLHFARRSRRRHCTALLGHRRAQRSRGGVPIDVQEPEARVVCG